MYDSFVIAIVVLGVSVIAGSIAHDYLCYLLDRKDDDA
jgi:hypothetical protein